MELMMLVALYAGGAVIGALIGAAFLLWGAKIAGIRGASFGRALGALILSSIAALAVFGISVLTGNVSEPVVSIISIVIDTLIIMAVFRTSFWRALLADILASILIVLVAGAIALFAIVAFHASLHL